MKLHLGCGQSPTPGWHNTDISPNILISRIPFAAELLGAIGRIPPARVEQHRDGVFKQIHHLDVTKRFPFPDNYAEAVFSSHIIEHLTAKGAKHMLSECLRVLKPGGICRIVAPSLEWAMELYDHEHPESFLNAVFEVRENNPRHRHWWMYTSESLQRTMRETGFAEVEACQYQKGRLPDLQEIDNRPKNSIYVEGTKASRI